MLAQDILVRGKRHLPVVIISAMMFLLGYEASGFQIALRPITAELGLVGVRQGALVSSQYFAIIIFPPILGVMADRLGKKKIVSLFGVVFSIGCLIVVFSQSYFVMVAGIFIIGCGYSVSESISVSLFTTLYPQKANKYVNISQSLFSLGAVISPIVNSWVMTNTRLTWRFVFVVTGSLYLLLSLILALINVKEKLQIQAFANAKGNKLSKEFILFFIASGILIYAGIEVGVGFFLDSFVHYNFEASSYSAYILSFFWFAMIPSRIVSGYLYKHKKTVLLVCYVVSVFALTLFAFNTNIVLSFILILLVGFSLGPIWPNLMSTASENTTRPGFASGLMSSACGLGGVIFPMLISTMSTEYGYRLSFILMGLIAAVGLAMTVTYFVLLKKSKISGDQILAKGE